MLAGLAVLPLGLLGRPDELAMTFGMLGLRHLHAMPLDARRAATAGVFFGFMGATSPSWNAVALLVAPMKPKKTPAVAARRASRGIAWRCLRPSIPNVMASSSGRPRSPSGKTARPASTARRAEISGATARAVAQVAAASAAWIEASKTMHEVSPNPTTRT